MVTMSGYEDEYDAQYIERPDGSVVVKPHVKKVKTGTWVFYPNNKSKGRSFKTYGKSKRVGGEPDTEYNPSVEKRSQPPEEYDDTQYEEQAVPQESQYDDGGSGGSIFTDMLKPRPRQQNNMLGMVGVNDPEEQMRAGVSNFLGGRRQRSILDMF